MDVVNLISDQEQYDEEVIFIAHRIGTRQPLRETTNNEGNQPSDPKEKEVYYGEVEVQKEIIGIKPLQDYPHFRFQCEVKKLSPANKMLHCEMCFCFICDEPVARCKQWLAHCGATDTERKHVISRSIVLRSRQTKSGKPKISKPKSRQRIFWAASDQGSQGLPR